jgi:hypothetical protein
LNHKPWTLNAALQVAYYIGCLAVICDPLTFSQRHFAHHKSAIVSLALHPHKVLSLFGMLGWSKSVFGVLAWLRGVFGVLGWTRNVFGVLGWSRVVYWVLHKSAIVSLALHPHKASLKPQIQTTQLEP